MKFLTKYSRMSFLIDAIRSQLNTDGKIETALYEFLEEFPDAFNDMHFEPSEPSELIRFIGHDFDSVFDHYKWYADRNFLPVIDADAPLCTKHGNLMVFQFPEQYVFSACLSPGETHYAGSMDQLADYLDLEIDYDNYSEWEDKVSAALLSHGLKVTWHSGEEDAFGPLIRFAVCRVTVDAVDYIVRFYYG